MSVSEEQILEALKQVEDPDLKQDIVSLGFIKNLKVDGGKVSFDVELTTPACPVKDLLKKQCEKNVRALPGVKGVEVKMTARVRQAVQTGIPALSGIKQIIAVASGKGGVGKSTVACNLAIALSQSGAKVGLMDADIYGPSIPTMLAVEERPIVRNEKVIPIIQYGLKIISMGLLATEETPIIWRGPMVAGLLQQFLGQVEWGELDYLVIDLPPGTGDAQLTLAQQAPISGAVIVTTPQDVSLLDARRGLKMFEQVQVPVLGIVENMSYFICDQCDKRHYIFKSGGGEKIATELKTKLLGQIPLDPQVAVGGDAGKPITLMDSDSSIAQCYHEIAQHLAQELSIRSEAKKQSSGGVDLPSFQMQWQK